MVNANIQAKGGGEYRSTGRYRRADPSLSVFVRKVTNEGRPPGGPANERHFQPLITSASKARRSQNRRRDRFAIPLNRRKGAKATGRYHNPAIKTL